VDKTNRRANRGEYLHFGIEPKANTGSERDEPQTTVHCRSSAVILMRSYSPATPHDALINPHARALANP